MKRTQSTPAQRYVPPAEPQTKSVMQRGLPMKTLDPKRLAQAGAVSSITGRRRVVGLRVVVISLLVLALLALLAVALAAASRAHAQSQVISAPCLHCVHLPAVMR